MIELSKGDVTEHFSQISKEGKLFALRCCRRCYNERQAGCCREDVQE